MEIRPILSALMRSKTGAVLVALQIAISLAILANAIHIVNQRYAVAARPSGITDEGAVFTMIVKNINDAAPGELGLAQKREAALLRAVPGVLSVADTNQIPLSRSGSTAGISVDRKQTRETASVSKYVTPDSLVKTWGLKLVEGRDFTPADVQEVEIATSTYHPDAVIITKALADKAYPGQASVIGKEFFFGTGEDAISTRIVGVVERLQSHSAQVEPAAEYSAIIPARRLSIYNYGQYAVRAEPGQRDQVMKNAEAALRQASDGPLHIRMKTADYERRDRYRADIALAWMLIAVSVLLLLVTASGIVGMASLWVTQRRKQIGVRRALGAKRVDILRYFILENVMITSAGVVLGVMLAIALNQLLVSQLEMNKLPLAYLLAGAVAFWVLGVAAVYGPAWRAASTSPALATRSA